MQSPFFRGGETFVNGTLSNNMELFKRKMLENLRKRNEFG